MAPVPPCRAAAQLVPLPNSCRCRRRAGRDLRDHRDTPKRLCTARLRLAARLTRLSTSSLSHDRGPVLTPRGFANLVLPLAASLTLAAASSLWSRSDSDVAGAVTAVIGAVVSVIRGVTPTRAAAGTVPAVTAVTAVTRPSVGARPDFVSSRVSRGCLLHPVRATESSGQT